MIDSFSTYSALPKDSIAEPFYAFIGEVFELKGGNLTGKLFLKVFSLQEAFKNCYI
jgi:hypothetical protein